MNIQELVKMLTDWTDQSGSAMWNMTHSRQGLVLNISSRHSSRKIQFAGRCEWPEAELVRGAFRFVDGF